MQKFTSFLSSVLLLCTVVACQKENIGVDDTAVFESNKQDILSYANSQGLSGTMSSSGLYFVLNKSGNSTIKPIYGDEVEFTYTLYALSKSSSDVTEKKVDSTYATSPVYFPFYNGSLKTGLEEGLLKMNEGDEATLLMPARLAFGDVETGTIPANSSVRFDVQLRRTRTEDQQIDEYMTANKLTPTEVTTSGLRFIKTFDNSDGITPTANQTYVLKYRGTLLRSASAFDSTGTGTYTTTLGRSIKGFDEGLAKLKVGEKATLIFPSSIGYGETGNQVIPPYAPMRFDIEVVSVL